MNYMGKLFGRSFIIFSLHLPRFSCTNSCTPTSSSAAVIIQLHNPDLRSDGFASSLLHAAKTIQPPIRKAFAIFSKRNTDATTSAPVHDGDPRRLVVAIQLAAVSAPSLILQLSHDVKRNGDGFISSWQEHRRGDTACYECTFAYLLVPNCSILLVKRSVRRKMSTWVGACLAGSKPSWNLRAIVICTRT
jgi:hypothetical protein